MRCKGTSKKRDTLIAKGIDVSAIYDGVEISFAKRLS